MSIDTESVVRERYAQAAQAREASLCCPVDYDAQYLKVIPQEVIDRDYGCGDPSKYVREGETVLDLGSGTGKICFIASQVVGPNGRVIGVDLNDDMLELARGSQSTVADAIGYDNVRFCKGKIQDMAIDRDAVDAYLKESPVQDEMSLRALESHLASLRASQPMIPDESVDVVVSNCVLNLVDSAEKEILFDEIYRVLRPGGRAVISDIVADEEVPEAMQADPELWSGCISGALQMQRFMEAFEEVGFVDLRVAELQSQPWQVVDGICFRSMTVIAYRPAEIETENAESLPDVGVRMVYRGPFKHVVDDEGHMFNRGETCDAELTVIAQGEPIRDQFVVFDADSSAQSQPSGALPSQSPPSQIGNQSQANSQAAKGPIGLPVSDGPCCGPEGCC